MALHAPCLAALVRIDLSASVHHYGDGSVGLRHAKVRQMLRPGVNPQECYYDATVEHAMTNRGPGKSEG